MVKTNKTLTQEKYADATTRSKACPASQGVSLRASDGLGCHLWKGTSNACAPKFGSSEAQSPQSSTKDLVSIGLARGSMIATLQGEIPIECLKVGDKVITRDIGGLRVRWIGARSVSATGLHAPIKIKAGTFKNHRDLLVAPNHCLLVSDARADLYFGESTVFLPAKYLVNGKSICRIEGGTVEYWQIAFATHQVIYSNGAMSESLPPDQLGADEKTQPSARARKTIFSDATWTDGFANRSTAARVLSKWEASLLQASLSSAAAVESFSKRWVH